jgi:hypothetical protein
VPTVAAQSRLELARTVDDVGGDATAGKVAVVGVIAVVVADVLLEIAFEPGEADMQVAAKAVKGANIGGAAPVRGVGRIGSMAFSFLYLAVRALLGALLRSRHGLDVKDIELLVLRHQLEILRRQRKRRPADRGLHVFCA